METYKVTVDKNGTICWYQNDKRHRLDGPAIEYADGHKSWYQNDKRHRLDGPAIECADDHKSWYIEGVLYTEEQFNAKINPAPSCEGKTVEVDGIKYKLVKE